MGNSFSMRKSKVCVCVYTCASMIVCENVCVCVRAWGTNVYVLRVCGWKETERAGSRHSETRFHFVSEAEGLILTSQNIVPLSRETPGILSQSL